MTQITEETPKPEVKKSLKTKIVDFVNDTATLDVITLSGNIVLINADDAPTDDRKEKDTFNWDNIFKKVQEKMQAREDSSVSIVAYTHAEWDQDSINYVAQDADTKLVEAHGKIVAAAHESRLNAVKSVVDVVEKLF